jgi:hypothetical protein
MRQTFLLNAMLGAPSGHLAEDGLEVLAFGGEGVFGAGWDFGVAVAGDDAVFFEVVEALGEGAGVDGADGFFKFAEAFRAAEQVAQDERGPFVTDNLHGAGDAANVWFEGFINRLSLHCFTLYSIGHILEST